MRKLHNFTYINNVLSNTSSPSGWHMSLDFCSIIVPSIVSLGLVSLKAQGKMKAYFYGLLR